MLSGRVAFSRANPQADVPGKPGRSGRLVSRTHRSYMALWRSLGGIYAAFKRRYNNIQRVRGKRTERHTVCTERPQHRIQSGTRCAQSGHSAAYKAVQRCAERPQRRTQSGTEVCRAATAPHTKQYRGAQSGHKASAVFVHNQDISNHTIIRTQS